MRRCRNAHDVISVAVSTMKQQRLIGHQALALIADVVQVGITPESGLVTAAVVAQGRYSFNEVHARQSFVSQHDCDYNFHH